MTAAQIIDHLIFGPLTDAAEHHAHIVWCLNESLTDPHRLSCLSDDPTVRAFADDWTDRLTAIRADLPN